jgi:hypothetical protein
MDLIGFRAGSGRPGGIWNFHLLFSNEERIAAAQDQGEGEPLDGIAQV